MPQQSIVAPETRTPTHENQSALYAWRAANTLMSSLIGFGLDGALGAAMGAVAGLALSFAPTGARVVGRMTTATRPYRAQAVARVVGYLPKRVTVALARRSRS